MVDLDALWDFSDPVTSETRFREASARAGSSSDSLVFRTQLARALGLQRRFDEAHAELDAVRDASEGATVEVEVRLRLERGRVHNSSGNRDGATSCFVQAMDLARQTRLDALAVDAAHMLGIAERGEAGERWTRRAIEMAEASSDPKARRWRGSLLNNLGWTRFEAGDATEALRCFQAALEVRIETGSPEGVRIARWSVARAQRELGRVVEALEAQRALEREYAEANESSGYVHEEIGECLLVLGRGTEARGHFRVAHRELSRDPWLVEREPDRLDRLNRLGEGTG
ncbi:MAG: tetratricopeptide repeat protein [bacterium]|nr:tetratricopeptide repeat protein [bacterium]